MNTLFCNWKTPVNNGIQTVYRALTALLTPGKQAFFLALTEKENCRIMERILEFADQKTTRKFRIFRLQNAGECLKNAAFSLIRSSFSERVNTTFLAVAVVEFSIKSISYHSRARIHSR